MVIKIYNIKLGY